MNQKELPPPKKRFGLIGLILVAFVVLISARTVASTVIEYQWWKELGQLATWFSMLLYKVAPVVIATLLAFFTLLFAHSRALRFANATPKQYRWYGRASVVVLLLLAIFIGSSGVETWTVVRYFAGHDLPADTTSWQDSVFGLPLSFYLFELPFYKVLHRFLLSLVLGAVFVYWLVGRGWQIKDRLPELQQTTEIDPRIFWLEGGLASRFLRGAAAVFLVALALRYFLGRYDLLFTDHGFMVGVEYVSEKITLPLQWVVIVCCLVAAVLVSFGRWMLAAGLVVVFIIHAAVPRIVSAVYVRPNEISIQRPYILKHINATRNAFNLETRTEEVEFPAQLESRIEVAKHRPLFDNVRLWDWRAFHDTTTQIQALRPYYTFPDSDVGRYVIDGQLRQVLLSPRELDIRQMPDARARWINPHFIYTHGYGMVMAEANRITPDGLPVLFVQDAPAQVKTDSLKLTRPEIYYGEITHEPVFVGTAQPEFNYPSGSENVLSRYEGPGGFPISSFPMRIAAAVAHGDVNILLTTYLSPGSRMMIRRNIKERLRVLAGFITWDQDPYLVLGEGGQLVWTVDGYTVSQAHPYSRSVSLTGVGNVNYVRNAVKATVDAYSGETRLYVFDPSDPIIRAYQKLFPALLLPASEMPDDLRKHARYPMTIFSIQAEIYRTYHMLDPQAFYNKEDVWDIARTLHGQETRPQSLAPTYVVATLPNETEAEFLLILPFTPRNKDNMLGLMVARCDGELLGELLFLKLSKQELIFGPMQIEARINQDQVISKDLTLWNQQGSQVLRGQMLVLPVEDTFVYVKPIYIQAAEARMPQLRKVVLSMGNILVYRDTYEEALQEMNSILQGGLVQAARVATPAKEATTAAPAAVATGPDPRVETIRNHLRRYRELVAESKWAEAGKELESIDMLVQR